MIKITHLSLLLIPLSYQCTAMLLSKNSREFTKISFNKNTGKYAISVTGISNGQCKITAIDKGNDEKFPTATEIKQSITGITTKKSLNAKLVKPTPSPKPGVKKASYKLPKG